MSDLLQKYKCKSSHKRVDKLGNSIEMRLTFEEWLKVWEDSGKLHLMGSGVGKYVMCRKDDIGHYEIGNVFIASGLDNILSVSAPLSVRDKEINELCMLLRYPRSNIRRLIAKGKILLECDKHKNPLTPSTISVKLASH